MPRKEIIGQKFGRLTVLCDSGERRNKGKIYICLCDCGKTKNVARNDLVSNRTKSCGCYNSEIHRNLFTDSNKNRKNPNARRPRVGSKQKLKSTLIAEGALGRSLKIKSLGDSTGEIVHHINQNNTDNRNCNLLICNQSYHVALHNKMKAKGYTKQNPVKT